MSDRDPTPLLRRSVLARADRANASLPDGVRVYAIGDVHGCRDLLHRLLGMITAHLAAFPIAAAKLVLLGDYIDRGPDSRGVLELIARGLPAQTDNIVLAGNHDVMLLQFLADAAVGPLWCQSGGRQTLGSYGIAVDNVLAAGGYEGLQEVLRRHLPPHHLKLLSTLPRSWSLGDYFFCHAGVRPGIPLDRQSDEDLIWIRGAFTNSSADFGKVVVHGHTPVAEPEVRSNRINIDTGAFASDRLTCLILEGETRRLITTRPDRESVHSP